MEDAGIVVPVRPEITVSEQTVKLIWQEFYLEVFDFRVNLTSIKVPAYSDGFSWVMFVLPEFSQSIIWNRCNGLFECYSCYSFSELTLDLLVPSEARDPRKLGAFACRLQNQVEPSEELMCLSSNMLELRRKKVVTLREALLFELFYFWRTGGHLNKINWTLCAGSRYRNKGVPTVCHHDGIFRVGTLGQSVIDESIRSRSVII